MHPYRASDLPENPKPTWLDTARVVVMAVLFLPVSFARFLWKWIGLVICIAIICGLLALAIHESEEHQRFSEECIRRGGFAMRTQDGSHCLDKNLAK